MVPLLPIVSPPAAPAACMTTPSLSTPVIALPHIRSEAAPRIHYDLEANPTSDPLSPARGPSPRPTLLDSRANSHDGQPTLKRQGSTDLVRYFVCAHLDPHTVPLLTAVSAWPSRPRQAHQMAGVPSNAW